MQTMSITLDGTTYRVGIVFDTLERSFDFIEGSNGGPAQAGNTVLDTIGTTYGYTMQIEPLQGRQADYDSLFWVISSPNRTHSVTLPFGQTTMTFDCYILGGTDRLKGRNGSDRKWGGLSLRFVPIAPARS